MAMTTVERLEAVFAEADERCRASGLPEPSIEEVVACCGLTGEGDAAMTKFYKLDERTAFLETPEEREAYLAAARELGDPELLEKAERAVARAERLESFTELCELTSAVPSVPWTDASKESDKEMLAERFEGDALEHALDGIADVAYIRGYAAGRAEGALVDGIKAAGLDADRCAWIIGDVIGQETPSPVVCIALYITYEIDDAQAVTDKVASVMVAAGVGVRLGTWVVPGADASQGGHALAAEASRRIFSGEALLRGDAFVAAKAEACPFCGAALVVSCDPLPPVDGEDVELAELYANGVEHTACTNCGYVGFDPAQTRKLQEQLAEQSRGIDELYASGVEHQACPRCGFVTFTEAQANAIHRRYWETRRQ